MEINKVNLSLFSLFHHDVSGFQANTPTFSDELWQILQQEPSADVNAIRKEIVNSISHHTLGIDENEIGLTLTGGFDSRVILAALLYLGIRPVCFTYGNPENKDIQIAKHLCKELGLTFYNVVNEKPETYWYKKWVNETIQLDHGNSHLHRSHRTAAIAELTKEQPLKVLFTGHLGGENIRGLSYNDYFASPFFEQFNEGKMSIEQGVEEQLKRYFINLDNSEKNSLITKIRNLPWMSADKQRNKLYFVNDLVGDIHHQQDIRLYSHYVEKVVPVFMQPNYRKTLAASEHHFMRKLNKKMPFLDHPKLYVELIDILFSPLLEYDLSNGYKPADYKRGMTNYLIKRAWKKFVVRPENTPSFSYKNWYSDYVRENASKISDEIWTFYNKNEYFESFNSELHQGNEGFWHRYSNPIFFDLSLKLNK